MLYRVDVIDSETGAEAVVFLNINSPADATTWLHAHGFAVGSITPAATAEITPKASPAIDPGTAANIRAIAHSPLIRQPLLTLVSCMTVVGVLLLLLWFYFPWPMPKLILPR